MCSQASYVFGFMYAGTHTLVSLNEFERVVRVAEIQKSVREK